MENYLVCAMKTHGDLNEIGHIVVFALQLTSLSKRGLKMMVSATFEKTQEYTKRSVE